MFLSIIIVIRYKNFVPFGHRPKGTKFLIFLELRDVGVKIKYFRVA
jgi:hypothetical protein